TSLMVKNAVSNCAYSDGFTGTNLPNPYWGFGKLDGKAAMLCIVTGKNEIKLSEGKGFYPNPFTDKTTFDFNAELKGKLFVYSPEGKLLFKDDVSGSTYELKSSGFSTDYKGMLIVRIITEKENFNFKIIRN
ncbi:MAG: hypothetical protein JWO32_220, partial [Bacteroidetes bacterium]|nr:hypothetical protein [Bacteroidota bacterium]